MTAAYTCPWVARATSGDLPNQPRGARPVRVTYRVAGTLEGSIWWPVGVLATKTFTYVTTTRPDSLRDLCEQVMTAEDGDFSGAPRMLADTTVVVTRWRGDGLGHRSRSIEVTRFPSLRDDYTSDRWPEWPDREG